MNHSHGSTSTKLKPRFLCVTCNRTFQKAGNLHHHIEKYHHKSKLKYVCKYCHLIFKSHFKYKEHINKTHRCLYCYYETSYSHRLKAHIGYHKTLPNRINNQSGRGSVKPFKEIKAFRGFFKTFRHRYDKNEEGPLSCADYLESLANQLRTIYSIALQESKHIKTQITILCQFVRSDESGFLDPETCDEYINSHMRILLNMNFLHILLSETSSQIINFVEIFEQNGSGWQLQKILGSDIRIAEFDPFTGGCFISLPPQIQNKRATINVRNNNSECFKWAFLSIAHYEEVSTHHRNRKSVYQKFENNYDFKSITFPSSLADVCRFEKLNEKKGFCINVFGVGERSEITVEYVSKFISELNRKKIDLLYYKDHADSQGHYFGIVDIHRLLGKHNMHRHHLCYNCLHLFTSTKKLKDHQKLCFSFKTQKVVMPDIGWDGNPPLLGFENFKHKLKVGYVIYADFEALPVDYSKVNKKTVSYQKHEPCGYSYVVVDSYQNMVEKEVYRGMDCIEKFFESVVKQCNKIIISYQNPAPMLPLTIAQVATYNKITLCHICQNEILPLDKCRDHCHISGKFRGGAHIFCNINYKQKSKVPIIFHNFQGYDCHLLMKGLKGYSGKLKVIPTNSEKFMSIIGVEFMFLDSMMFLNASLDQLVQNLKQDMTDYEFEQRFKILISVFGSSLGRMLSRKGVYPYEYMNKWSRFEETKFPDRSCFYSSLREENVSISDHAFGKKVFEQLCFSMGDYHNLYLLTDVLLLACVFENFRSIAIQHNDLDPMHYFSLAGYAWDIALYKSKQYLEQFISVDMYNFIELGIRGGVSMISQRMAKANNKYMDSYDPEIEDSYLMLFDKNNLYGEAMMQFLPTHGFEWATNFEIKNLSEDMLKNWEDNSPDGCILMVDLEYPIEFHMEHNDYPLAPEKVNVTLDKLSQYQRDLKNKLDISYSSNQSKLIPHLGCRYNYICHYRALKTWLKKGMKVLKIHKVLKFKQSDWLREHVSFCTYMRSLATSEFEKSYWKFLVNSVFGKSGENLRKRVDVRIVTNKFSAKRLTALSEFKTFKILDDCEDVVIVTLKKPMVKLTRPIYTTFTVLELSKVFMYEFYYDKAKLWWSNNVSLLMTDTDSFGLQIYTKDVYQDMKNHADEFDLSDYPKTHELFSVNNKKVIGKMKDEANGEILEEFVGLAPKMYSFYGKSKQKSAYKGIKKSMARKHIRHSMIRRILLEQKKMHCRMNLIRSKGHKIFTISVQKAALHCFDSKRFIKPDGCFTLAHNHFLIPKNTE